MQICLYVHLELAAFVLSLRGKSMIVSQEPVGLNCKTRRVKEAQRGLCTSRPAIQAKYTYANDPVQFRCYTYIVPHAVEA